MTADNYLDEIADRIVDHVTMDWINAHDGWSNRGLECALRVLTDGDGRLCTAIRAAAASYVDDACLCADSMEAAEGGCTDGCDIDTDDGICEHCAPLGGVGYRAVVEGDASTARERIAVAS